jgi:hypothetical protein
LGRFKLETGFLFNKNKNFFFAAGPGFRLPRLPAAAVARALNRKYGRVAC